MSLQIPDLDTSIPSWPFRKVLTTVAAALVGAATGWLVCWIAPVYVSFLGGFGEAQLWAVEAARDWSIAGLGIGAIIGLVVSSVNDLPIRNCPFFCWPWIITTVTGATVGILAGEWTSAMCEPTNQYVPSYRWNPWPGGVGLQVGAILGFVAWYGRAVYQDHSARRNVRDIPPLLRDRRAGE
jgi:hypothetical protein